MINSEKRRLLHDYYQPHILVINNSAVVFLKITAVKPINQSILNIS